MNTTYPDNYDSAEWTRVFTHCMSEEVDNACMMWFKQWAEIENLYSLRHNKTLACMPSLHALSNRTDAPLESFLNYLDAGDKGVSPNFFWAKEIFVDALAMRGWEGFAMRCWTDPKGYAGLLQFINNEGLFELVNDLAGCKYVGFKLKEALEIYPEELKYPWIGAACVRWVLFSQDNQREDLPTSVQWLHDIYAVCIKNDNSIFDKIINFGELSVVISALLNCPLFWEHMVLQEGDYSFRAGHETLQLWMHWSESIGLDMTEEKSFLAEQEYSKLYNRMYGGDAIDLEMMELLGMYKYTMQQISAAMPSRKLSLPIPDIAIS